MKQVFLVKRRNVNGIKWQTRLQDSPPGCTISQWYTLGKVKTCHYRRIARSLGYNTSLVIMTIVSVAYEPSFHTEHKHKYDNKSPCVNRNQINHQSFIASIRNGYTIDKTWNERFVDCIEIEIVTSSEFWLIQDPPYTHKTYMHT